MFRFDSPKSRAWDKVLHVWSDPRSLETWNCKSEIGKKGRLTLILLWTKFPCRVSKEDWEYVSEISAWDLLGGPMVKTLPSNAKGAGSIPGRGAKISHALKPKTKILKQKLYCNKFNKHF